MGGYRRRCRGFTLVEIMVAMTIGLIVTASAVALFISNRQSYEMAEAVGRLQEAGRFAVQAIAEDLRMAGHYGCAEPRQITVNSTDPRLNVASVFTQPIDFDTTSKQLTIRYASGSSTELATDMASTSSPVVLDGHSGMDAGANALIANCTRADVFTVAAESTTQISGSTQHSLQHSATDSEGDAANTSNDLSEAYEVGTNAPPRIRTFNIRQYRVNATADTNAHGDSVGALLRNGHTLVRGVERMEVRFGECTAAGEIEYSGWSGVDDPAKLVAVRFGLLLHSEQRVLDQPDSKTYRIAEVQIFPPGSGDGSNEHAGDTRLRRAFSTTVSLRNERAEQC